MTQRDSGNTALSSTLPLFMRSVKFSFQPSTADLSFGKIGVVADAHRESVNYG